MTESPSLTSVRRSWLERVLDVVRGLGASSDLTDILERITQAVVDVLEFGAAAINVVESHGELRIAAVAGPEEARTLLGRTIPRNTVQRLIDTSERWGALCFLGHGHDESLFDGVATWTPEATANAEPDAWHPDDVLFAPLWANDGSLLGVLSVDQPASGRRPDAEQRTVLELFATQAARAIGEATARWNAEARQREAERHWQLTFEHSPVGTALVAADGTIRRVNPSFAQMLGYLPEEVAGRTFAELTYADDVGKDLALFSEIVGGRRESYQMEKRYLHRDGHVVWGVLHVGVIRDDDGGIESVVGQVNDITARKLAEEQLAHRATHDPLTDLPNRALLEEQLATYLAAGRRCGVLFCDLDRFKTINDSLGHEVGDELLTATTRRLRAALPAGATVGRVGGDEFVVLVPGEADPERLRGIGARIMRSLAQPLRVAGRMHTVAVSIGVTASGPWHDHPDEVLRQADQALLRAKRQGRARVEVYDPAQDRLATVDDLELEQSLRATLTDGHGLVPYFQPVMDIADNRPVGYEALVRWRHPTRGLLEPDEFLPLAEQTGLIVPLGWWMLAEGCRTAGHPPLVSGWSQWIAVNASGSQLGRHQLVNAVRSALDSNHLTPQRLHLEITETALVDASPSAIKEVHQVADLGVSIALDDFGTGYSSLSLLRDLPVSAVKIDQSFVRPITVDHNAMAIVRSVIGLCRELGVTTVAEGVESEDQLTALRALGCTQAQGYLIGRPMPLDQLQS